MSEDKASKLTCFEGTVDCALLKCINLLKCDEIILT